MAWAFGLLPGHMHPLKRFGENCHDSVVEELGEVEKWKSTKKRMVRVKYAALTVDLSVA